MYFIKMHYKNNSNGVEFDRYKGILQYSFTDTSSFENKIGYKTLSGVKSGLRSMKESIRMENEAGFYQLKSEIIKV